MNSLVTGLPTGLQPMRPMRYLAEVNSQSLPETHTIDTDIEYLDIGAVGHGEISLPPERMTFGAAPSRARRVVQKDDILVSTVRTYLRAVARIAEPPENLIASTGFAVLRARPDVVEPRFLFYWCLSDHFIESVVSKSTGVSYPAISASDLLAMPVFCPPLDTQRRIADVLDTETTRIDVLIKKNERVLALLAQRETSLITAAVTGAVEVDQFGDPRPPRRGDAVIPAQTVPLRYLARLDPGKSEVKHLPDDLEVDFIPMEAVGHGGRLAPTETRPLGEVRDGYTYLKSGDVTFAKISPSFQNRKGGRAQGLTNGLAFATTELTILRPEPATDARFLQYVIESEPFIQHGAATLHGVAGQQRVDLSRVAAFPVWSPDIDTQRRIADMLDAEIEKTDALKSTVNRQQELLRLRRQSLITAAVTGQIEV